MFQASRTFWRHVSSGPREKQAIAFLRVAVGLFFLYGGQRNLADASFADHLSAQLIQWAAHNPFPFYQAFLQTLIIPNAAQVTNILIDAEILVGVSYLTGLLVPISAPIAIFLSVNALLATQHMEPLALPLQLALIGISLTLFWGRAGLHYGLDGLFGLKPSGKVAKSGKAAKRKKFTQAPPPPAPASAKRSKSLDVAKRELKKALNEPKVPKPKPAAPAPQPAPTSEPEPGFRKILIHNHLDDDDDEDEDDQESPKPARRKGKKKFKPF